MSRLLSSNLNMEAKHTIFAQKSAKSNLNSGLSSIRVSRKKQCRVCDLHSASQELYRRMGQTCRRPIGLLRSLISPGLMLYIWKSPTDEKS
jgi:hypothetical protein